MTGAHKYISNLPVQFILQVSPDGSTITWMCGTEHGSIHGQNLVDTLERLPEVLFSVLSMYESVEVLY